MTKEGDRSQRKALGKGLSALLPSRVGSAVPVPLTDALPAKPALPESFENFQSIALHQISPNEEQPRSVFEDDKLQELAQSIRANGLLQPVTVYRVGPNQYKLIAGERRWRAASLAGLQEIPALVRSVEQHQLLELALIENIQREDLNAIEIATAFHSLATHHGLSHEQIAERTGKDRSTVTNFVRLLRLSPFVRDALKSGQISVGHARTLLNVTDEDSQADICRRISEQQLSVRETERLVKNLTSPVPDQKKGELKTEGEKIDPNVRAALEEIAAALGTKVKLYAKSATSGRLEIEYYSQEDLDRIYSVITKQ
ncbi:MAG: ParB/RepB/Spo0J family partition protein [Acidobacteriaceae bacterium]|nr:ParB/RepB/Spo0J family partition protein [Acidobacteriaceae bacterium]